MELRPLGRTGMGVSPLALGTMMFGAWGTPDERECTRMVDLALEAGINLVDTADIYSGGQSEAILGRAVAGRRDGVVLATKFANPTGPEPWRRGASRRWIVRAVEDSLRRLRTDRVDLCQVHRPDPATAIDETLAALDDLVRAGKVVAVGTSTFPAAALVEAQHAALAGGHVRPATEQPPYSMLARGVEAEVLPTCLRHGIAVLAYAPLNGGWLTGKYGRGAAPPAGSRADREPAHFDLDGPARDRKLDVVEALAKLAADAGLPLPHLAIAWVLAHPAVTAAILGPRTPAQLAELVGAAGVVLDDDLLDRVDALVAPRTDLNPADAGWVPAGLAATARRRP